MNDIFALIGKILGLLFAAAVILYTSLLTWQLAGRLIPDSPIGQAMTLVLFDLGAFVWFVTFLTQAKGTLQWAIAGLGFVVGLAGAVIMAAGELVLGQSLVQLDDPTKIGWVLIATVIVAALAHASLTYAFHFADPATKNRIENAQEVSKTIEQAYKDARSEIARNSERLSSGLRDSVLYEAERQIAMSTAAHIRNGGKLEQKTGEILRGGDIVDVRAVETPPASPQAIEDAQGTQHAPETPPASPQAIEDTQDTQHAPETPPASPQAIEDAQGAKKNRRFWPLIGKLKSNKNGHKQTIYNAETEGLDPLHVAPGAENE